MQQFVKQLTIKQSVKKKGLIEKDLIKELKDLERPDLLVDRNNEEAQQLV